MNRISVNIPKERVGVLIGRRGKIKQRIEKSLTIALKIDSSSGNVTAESSGSNPINIWRARDIVIAIGRGFSPEKTFKMLSNDETLLEMIDLRTIFGRSDKSITRVKARIIGKEGKTRSIIEEVSNTDVSVYGHTISIIGGYENLVLARDAIKMLIDGKSHATVYKFLSNKRRELKKREKTELWK
jgi:ribosomal RNA assembly protein